MKPIQLSVEHYGRRVSSPSTIFTLTVTEENIQELRSKTHTCLGYGCTLVRVPGMLRMLDGSTLAFTFSPSEGFTLYKFGSPYFPVDELRIQRREKMAALMELVWREIYRNFSPPIAEIEPHLVKSFEIRGLSFSLKATTLRRFFEPGMFKQILDNDDLGVPTKEGLVECIISRFDLIEDNQYGFSLRFKYGADWESPEKRFEFTVEVVRKQKLLYYGCSKELATEIAGLLV